MQVAAASAAATASSGRVKLTAWTWPKELEGKLERPGPSTGLRFDRRPQKPRFGSIRFARGSRRPAKFVCIGKPVSGPGLAASIEALLQLMIEPSEFDTAKTTKANLWHLSAPPLLISVVGAAGRQLDEHELPSHIKHVFLRGLRAAAAKTRAWILTVGTNVGVAALVGEVMQAHSADSGDDNLVLIGMAPFQQVPQRQLLLEGHEGTVSQRRSGLLWHHLGHTRPLKGNEIFNAALATALESKHEFTRQEFDMYKVANLGRNDFIRVGAGYFGPLQLWQDLGTRSPDLLPTRSTTGGNEIYSPKLAEALLAKHEFTRAEFEPLYDGELAADDYIKVGANFFGPVSPMPAVDLEPNHTHFVLVDDGDTHENHWGCEVELRTAFEETLQRERRVAQVLLVINGGLRTLEIIHKGLSRDPPQRVIVLAGSNGAAGDLEHFYHQAKAAALARQADCLDLLSSDLAGATPRYTDPGDSRCFSNGLSEAHVKRYLAYLRDITSIVFTSATRGRPVLTFFECEENDGGKESLAKAADRFCELIHQNLLVTNLTPQQSLIQAVEWAKPDFVAQQLREWPEGERYGLSRGFERALALAASPKVSHKDAAATMRTIALFFECGLVSPKELASSVRLGRLLRHDLNIFDIFGFGEQRSGERAIYLSEVAFDFLGEYLQHSGYEYHLQSRKDYLNLEQAAIIMQRRRKQVLLARAHARDGRSSLAPEASSTSGLLEGLVSDSKAAASMVAKQMSVLGRVSAISSRFGGTSARATSRRSRWCLCLGSDVLYYSRALTSLPPKDGWKVELATGGDPAEPSVAMKTSKTDPAVQYFEVRNAGLALINGDYMPSGELNGRQRYKKRAMGGSCESEHTRERRTSDHSRASASDAECTLSFQLPPVSFRSMFAFKAQPHTIIDLTIWAMLVGRPQLARLLWERTSEPVRTGLILSKVVQQIRTANFPGSGRQCPKEQPEMFERWSCEVLDKITDFKSARLVLCSVLRMYSPPVGASRREIEHTSSILSWKHAVMDLAIDIDGHDLPNMEFLSHPYAMRLVTAYFNGDYVNTEYRILRSRTNGYMESWLIIFHLITLGFFLLLLPSGATGVKLKENEDYAMERARESSARASGHLDDGLPTSPALPTSPCSSGKATKAPRPFSLDITAAVAATSASSNQMDADEAAGPPMSAAGAEGSTRGSKGDARARASAEPRGSSDTVEGHGRSVEGHGRSVEGHGRSWPRGSSDTLAAAEASQSSRRTSTARASTARGRLSQLTGLIRGRARDSPPSNNAEIDFDTFDIDYLVLEERQDEVVRWRVLTRRPKGDARQIYPPDSRGSDDRSSTRQIEGGITDLLSVDAWNNVYAALNASPQPRSHSHMQSAIS